jgi:ribose transport system ATP-binding protein
VGFVLTFTPTTGFSPSEGPDHSGDAEPVLTARAVSKQFAGRTVLDRFAMDLRRGEIRGLLGHNGSGKSTFVKILSGYHQPEPGAAVTVCGHPLRFSRSGQDPARRSMAFVHQDLGLVATATVVESFGVGRYATSFGRKISWSRQRTRLHDALDRFDVYLPPERTIAELAVTDQAILAIARAFDQLTGQRQGVLVLDEPTAFLPQDGVERVFEAIRTVAHHGIGVLLITHNITHALTITEQITVLRDGQRVLDSPTSALSSQDLVNAMVTDTARTHPAARRSAGPRRVALEVRDLSDQVIHGVSFKVRAGEIVGLTGVLGSGFQRIPYLLFGATPAQAGSLSVDGHLMALAGLTPARAIDIGLCLVPGDRARQAAVLDAPAADNITLGNLRRHVRWGLLRQDSIVAHATTLMSQAGVRPLQPRRDLRTFSGGNQQKAVLAKWLDRTPKVLLLDEPVHGVDLTSRAQIFTGLAALANTGTAIILASVDHEDLIAVCDTVFVIAHGGIAAQLRGSTLTTQQILAACYQQQPAADSPAQPPERV